MEDLRTLIRKAAGQPLLGRDEERRLARQAGAGDAEATRRLVVSHLLFVVRLAKRYRGSGLPMTDLVQEGVVGLLRAIRRFDPDHGARFSTYAAWWVRAAMQDYAVRSWSLVRVEGYSVATERRAAITGQVMSRLVDGRVAEAYNHFDFISFFEMLGLLPEDTMTLCMTGQRIA